MPRTDERAVLSTIQVVRVPDIWPPIEGEPVTGVRQAQVIASLEPPGESRSEPRAGEPAAAWPRQFAVLLAEALAGTRPASQLKPWLSDRASAQAHRLGPLFGNARQLRVTRVISTYPARDVIEMTIIVDLGTRRRALAIRLELGTTAAASPRWLCTAVEAA